MANKIYLEGQRFGRLIVIKDLKECRNGKSIWLCLCDCGQETICKGCDLRRGHTKSCGCGRILDTCFNWMGVGELSGGFFDSIKLSAEKRNLIFEVNKEFLWDLFIQQDRKCAISGVEIRFSKNCKKDKGTASLDRKDSTEGYTINNVQWVHKEVNKIKQNLNENDFIEWCHKISKFNEGKK